MKACFPVVASILIPLLLLNGSCSQPHATTPHQVLLAAPQRPPSADPFGDAVNLAMQAAILTQSAQTKSEWETVEGLWSDAIDLMRAVPVSHARYSVAQAKVEEYKTNRDYAIWRRDKTEFLEFASAVRQMVSPNNYALERQALGDCPDQNCGIVNVTTDLEKRYVYIWFKPVEADLPRAKTNRPYARQVLSKASPFVPSPGEFSCSRQSPWSKRLFIYGLDEQGQPFVYYQPCDQTLDYSLTP